MLRAPGFRDERGAAAPLASHAQAEQKAKGRELGDGIRKTAGSTGKGIDEDGGH